MPFEDRAIRVRRAAAFPIEFLRVARPVSGCALPTWQKNWKNYIVSEKSPASRSAELLGAQLFRPAPWGYNFVCCQ